MERGKKGRARLTQTRIRELQEADAEMMEAVVAGCALVAYSDGWVTLDETRRMSGLIRQFEPVRAFGGADIAQAFDEIAARFTRDHDEGADHAWSIVRRLANRPHDAALLIETCCAIAEADGGFDAEERQTILELCERLGVSPSAFSL